MKSASVPKMFRRFKLLSAIALAGVLMLPLWEQYATSMLMADDGVKKQDMRVLQLNDAGIPPIDQGGSKETESALFALG